MGLQTAIQLAGEFGTLSFSRSAMNAGQHLPGLIALVATLIIVAPATTVLRKILQAVAPIWELGRRASARSRHCIRHR
jgi:hypothetical protein